MNRRAGLNKQGWGKTVLCPMGPAARQARGSTAPLCPESEGQGKRSQTGLSAPQGTVPLSCLLPLKDTLTHRDSQEDDLPCPPRIYRSPHPLPAISPGGLSAQDPPLERQKAVLEHLKAGFSRRGLQTGWEPAEEPFLSACSFCFQKHSPQRFGGLCY